VVNLMELDDTVVSPWAPSELQAGVRSGASVRFPDGSTYRLGFDRERLLVWAQGPLDLSPFGAGEITARFSDYRTVGGLHLPFAASYALAAMPIADETVQRLCVDPADLTPAAFGDPISLPRCPLDGFQDDRSERVGRSDAQYPGAGGSRAASTASGRRRRSGGARGRLRGRYVDMGGAAGGHDRVDVLEPTD
jgi:hypothetical protein